MGADCCQPSFCRPTSYGTWPILWMIQVRSEECSLSDSVTSDSGVAYPSAIALLGGWHMRNIFWALTSLRSLPIRPAAQLAAASSYGHQTTLLSIAVFALLGVLEEDAPFQKYSQPNRKFRAQQCQLGLASPAA